MDAQTRPQLLAKPRGHGFAQAPTALISSLDRKTGSERTGREVQISTLLLGQRQLDSSRFQNSDRDRFKRTDWLPIVRDGQIVGIRSFEIVLA
jgi:hypothetical protein